MDAVTISRGSSVKSAERAAAPHEWSSSERRALEGRKAPAAAEAGSRSSWTRSGTLLANAASFQSATSLTATRVTAPAAEAAAPSKSNAGFGRSAASLFTSTGSRCCWCCQILRERGNISHNSTVVYGFQLWGWCLNLAPPAHPHPNLDAVTHTIQSPLETNF